MRTRAALHGHGVVGLAAGSRKERSTWPDAPASAIMRLIKSWRHGDDRSPAPTLSGASPVVPGCHRTASAPRLSLTLVRMSRICCAACSVCCNSRPKRSNTSRAASAAGGQPSLRGSLSVSPFDTPYLRFREHRTPGARRDPARNRLRSSSYCPPSCTSSDVCTSSAKRGSSRKRARLRDWCRLSQPRPFRSA